MNGPQQSRSRQRWSLSHCGTNVNEIWRCFWDAHPGFEQKEKVLGKQCFWCSYLLWCSPITLDLLWRAHSFLCMVLSSSSRTSWVLLQAPCRHRARQSVAALWSQLCHWAQELVSSEVFLWFLVAKWFCLKQSTLYRAEKAQSFNAFFGNSFTEKTIVLRVKERPWKITVASGSWRQMQTHCINESLTLCACVCVFVWEEMIQMHGCVKEKSQRERLFEILDRVPRVTHFYFVSINHGTVW